MRLLTFFLLAAIGAVVFSACTTRGPISEPTTAIVGGVAATILFVLDQLFAAGILEPEQYRALNTGIVHLATSAAQAATGVDEVRRGLGTLGSDVQKVAAEAVTATEALMYGGIAAAGVGAGVPAVKKLAKKST